MAEHAQLPKNTCMKVYFCDPYSPWQRGSNENTNGLLRQYFPEGTKTQMLGLNLNPPRSGYTQQPKYAGSG